MLGRPDVRVVSNPEFLREGTAVHDCLHPDRIVVGATTGRGGPRGRALLRHHAPLIVTDAATAETIKYASNAFLATKLSSSTRWPTCARRSGADVRDVLLGMGYDKRIGFEFLRPGPGWGGSCFPKDTRALLHIAARPGYDFSLLAGAIASNDEQLARVVGQGRDAAGGALDGVTVGRLGPHLQGRHRRPARLAGGADRAAAGRARGARSGPSTPPCDAAGRTSPRTCPAWSSCADPYEAATGARVLVVLTEWDEFRWLDFAKVHAVMAVPAIVDARNLLDPAAVRRMGFAYTGIGRR